MDKSIFQDDRIQRELVAQAIWDRAWLRAVGDLISQNDFKPLSGQEGSAWVIVGIALDFWRKYRDPVGSLIDREVHRWATQTRLGSEKTQALRDWVKDLKKLYRPARSEVLQDQVLEFKTTRKRQRALKEMIELDAMGGLTEEKWLKITRAALNGHGKFVATDWFDGVADRTERRSLIRYRKIPDLMIDPLDSLVKGIGRGQIGLWLALYKMGKSLALIWIAVSYLIQRLNVLFITLEDPKDDVEDRIDACVSEVRIEELGFQGPRIKIRMERFRNLMRSRLKIVDGTEGGLTVAQVESVWERERTMGFTADVIIIDYDDEIRAVQKQKDRRFELAEIYRDMRQLAARRQVILWTAAQAKRAAEGRNIVTADMIAEDISKIRKVTLAISIGQGEWGDDARFLYVAAHKFDIQKVSCQIWSNLSKSMFYDRDKTLMWMERERSQPRKKEDE